MSGLWPWRAVPAIFIAVFVVGCSPASAAVDTTFLESFGQAHLSFPAAIDIGPLGNAYVVDGAQGLVAFDHTHGLQWQVAGSFTDVAVERPGGDAQRVFALESIDGGGGKITERNAATGAVAGIPVDTTTGLRFPAAMVIVDAGAVRRAYVADVSLMGGDGRLLAFDLDTGQRIPVGALDGSPSGMAPAPGGDLLIADPAGHQVVRLTTGGGPVRTYSTTALDAVGVITPSHIAVGRDGDSLLIADGPLGVPDATHDRVVVMSLTDAFTPYAIGTSGSGPGRLSTPLGIATDCRGRIYVADSGNSRVSVFGASGLADAPCDPPTVGAAATVRDVTPTAATVSAEINGHGDATTVRVEYGPTTSHGTVTAEHTAADGSAAVQLHGLQPSTAYHAMLVATNSYGTANSDDVSFTTAAPAIQPPPGDLSAAPPIGGLSTTTPAKHPKPATPRRCTVPKLRGLMLTRARARIKAAGCSNGHVKTPRHRPRHAKLVVSTQSPPAGRSVPRGTKVSVTLKVKR